MSSKVKTARICIVVATLASALGGCAATSLIYPSTSGIDKMSQKTLTPLEQKAVIDDLLGPDGKPVKKPLIKASTDGTAS